jgi:hypothetical protein
MNQSNWIKPLTIGLLVVLVVSHFPASIKAVSNISTFSFGFAGDFFHNQHFHSNLDSVSHSDAAFFLALGDLAYGPNGTSLEQNWCSQFKASFNNAEIVTGNHDSGESKYGSILKYVKYCPWTLSGTTIVPGVEPGFGYGYEYYFDYPAVSPLARFIMISPGINFTIAQAGFDDVWAYSLEDEHYDWVSNAIDSAHAGGIPWVVVGMHKPCLLVVEHASCSSPSLMSLLLSKKVDLVINAHMHMYARSKQLICATYASFSSSCIADSGNFLSKGAGTVLVTTGTGGQELDNIDPAKTQNAEYFATMNNNTWGYSEVSVTTTSLQIQFVPTNGSFTDNFTIQPGPQRSGTLPALMPYAEYGAIGFLFAVAVLGIALRRRKHRATRQVTRAVDPFSASCIGKNLKM